MGESGGGGGLTALFTGTSEGLEPSNVPNVMLIAGGGGGASVRSLGGAGGGISGNNGFDSGLDGGGAIWAGIGQAAATP